MSSEGFRKRRCIIKKLDFENCIVTNIKTRGRRRQKLRARITREIEDYPEVPETVHPPEEPPLASPETSQETISQRPRETSPVLVRRQLKERESPVFFKRKKANFPAEEGERASEDSTAEEGGSTSPVFKLFKKSKTPNESPGRCEEIENSFKEDSFLSAKEDSSSGVESYQIDETTTQESKDSIKISSVESAVKKDSSSSVYSIGSGGVGRGKDVGEMTGKSCVVAEKWESPKGGKRNYKKNSLLGRLHKLQQKQASEKLLWQHQNRRNTSSSLRFSVVALWKEDFNFFLKCRSHASDPSITFLVVDSRWVPKLKSVKEASVLLLHPPWQKVTVEESGMTVLVNVICLDVLEETEDCVAEKKTFEPVPTEEFETLERLFIDSLFCSSSSGFLC